MEDSFHLIYKETERPSRSNIYIRCWLDNASLDDRCYKEGRDDEAHQGITRSRYHDFKNLLPTESVGLLQEEEENV